MYALLLAANLYFPAQPVETVAMVLDVKSKATFERDKDAPRRLGVMALLRPGDRVAVPDDGEVILIFLNDGHRERIKPAGRITVEANGCKPPNAVEKIVGRKLPEANLESLRDLARSSRGAVGVVRGEKAPSAQLVTPLYGATIQTVRPTFTWKDAKAEAYLVQFYSGSQGKDQKLLWRATVKSPTLAYPEKEKPLELGRKYQWKVIPLKGEDASADPIVVSKFLVLTKIEIDMLANLKPLLASKQPTDWLLAALSYEAHGVYGEALSLYERLAQVSPNEPNYQSALASYYGRAGRQDLAAKTRERAKKLERR